MRRALLGVVLGLGLAAAAFSATLFDRASAEYVDMGVVAAHSLSDAHTAAVAFLPESISFGVSYNLFTRQDGGTSRSWAVYTNSDIGYTFRASSGGDSVGGYLCGEVSDGLAGGTPYILLGSFDSGADSRLFRDGSQSEIDASVASTDSGGTEHTMLGAAWSSGAPTSSYLDGTAVRASLHDRQLGAIEVAHQAVVRHPDPQGLVSDYALLDCAVGASCDGLTALDWGPAQAHGTYTGGTGATGPGPYVLRRR